MSWKLLQNRVMQKTITK